MIEMRRYFHEHPEVSMKEYETSKKIQEELKSMNIPFELVGETGVYAWIDGKKEGNGKTIFLRADIDALAMQDLKTDCYASKNKGACHACGHDMHTASLLGTSKILKSLEHTFSGKVKLCFQQGEEYGAGARLFVEKGLLKDCDRAFGFHVASRLEVGKVAITSGPQCAACDYFKIKITGKGTHVSTPHLGIDAVYIASQIVIGLQSIVSRNTAPLETVVVGVGVLQAGTQYNIVAEHALIEGTTRTFSKEIQAVTNQKVIDIATQIANLHGAEAEVIFENYAMPLINDEEVVAEVVEVAKGFLKAEQIVNDYEKALGADDFADFLQEVQGMYAFVGTGNADKPNTTRPHHHGLFDIDEESLSLGSRLCVEYALSVVR